ncbi:undecaprenyldiphospho-muramoylpentapeptide beta-N-acetylglucosaminyltransferase [Stomatohabitans albus]|uniref:undecaprenyldiphospho-muramoylpentapeptide beta-N-acetylglucosaminyltransferase n=1 Tax=Stomatohabitans albus TaxID=3110766 RepID=UPI00300CEF6E
MSDPSPTVLIAAGGTGGHIFPGLATADAIRALRPDIHIEFVGTKDRMEATLVPDAGYHLNTVDAMALPRKTDPRILRLPFVLGKSVHAVSQIMQRHHVIAACGFGGYTSVSLGLAARLHRIPLVIHEQNAVPGVTNKVLSPIATRVVGTFEATMDAMHKPRSGAIGNPVRTAFAEAITTTRMRDRGAIYARFGLTPDRKTIVVFGGSQGAKAINNAIIAAANNLTNPEQLQILHATGERTFDDIRRAWDLPAQGQIQVRVLPFIADMADALQIADVVVCRSGASTLAELTVMGLPAILVPYPHATGNHQFANAQAMTQAQAAILIEDTSLDGPRLADTIEQTLEPRTNARMRHASAKLGRPNAARDLAQILLEVSR